MTATDLPPVPGGQSRPRRRWIGRRSLAVVAAGGMVLAACGDGADDDASDLVDDVGQAADDAVREATDAAADAADKIDSEEVDAEAAALADTLRANGMATLASAIEQIDFSQLVDSDEFTLFGPNDAAFLALETDTVADLLANPDELVDVLRSHVVEGRVESSDLADMASIQTRAGTTLAVAEEGGTVTVGNAEIVRSDIDAGAGVIHVVDQVLST